MALGTAIVVPIVNPGSSGPLMRLAAVLAAGDDGIVVPVTVVGESAGPQAGADAHDLVRRAEVQVAEAGGTARGIVTVAATTAAGVLEAIEDREATLVVMGWRGVSSTRNVFGELIDQIVGRSSVPLAVIRVGEAKVDRVLFPISTDHLLPAGARGVDLAGELVNRFQKARGLPVVVLRAGPSDEPLPEQVGRLGDRVHHDSRRVDVAVGAVARPEDLIVTPVAPTTSGLRAATTHLAWAAPFASLVVAIDVGPRPTGDLAKAVRRANEVPERTTPAATSASHAVRVSVWLAPGAAVELDQLVALVADLGATRDEASGTDDGRAWLSATVEFTHADRNAALAAVMARLHETDVLRGADIHYDVASSDS